MRTKRKFSPKTAKRKLQYLIPNNGQTMSTVEYLVTFLSLERLYTFYVHDQRYTSDCLKWITSTITIC